MKAGGDWQGRYSLFSIFPTGRAGRGIIQEDPVSYPQLQELVQGYSTPFLLEQYLHARDEYTADAIKIMEAELARRNVGKDQIDEYSKSGVLSELGDQGNVTIRHLKRDDFAKLDGSFSRSDGVLIRAMFGDEDVPFFLDTSVNPSVVPGQETAVTVGVYVHKDSLDKARELVAGHFDLVDGVFKVRHADMRERLVSFSFDEIPQQELDSAEITGVHFSQEEKGVLIRLGKRLQDEIDEIENRDGRIVFHFDNVEELLEQLDEKDPALTKTLLLTALEILQIYAKDEEFGDTAQGIAQALLGFFLQ
jgi:hypothetical protein